MSSLVAYLDESGIDDQSRIVAVAGLLATQGDWDVFSARWTALLENAGLPALHMRLFEEGRSPYQHLDRDLRAALQASLIDLINETPLFMQACCIIRGDKENRAGLFADLLAQPYTACVGDVMTALLRKAEQQPGPSASVDFICGDQRELRKDARDQYESMRDDPDFAFLRHRFGAITFRGTKEDGTVPLQAADLVAYEARKAGINLQEGRPERKSYARLTSRGKLTLHHADRNGLEHLANQFKVGNWPPQ